MKSIIIESNRQLIEKVGQGNPLIRNILNDLLISSNLQPTEALTQALHILVDEDLPQEILADKEIHNSTLDSIRKLSLVGIPFRTQDIRNYVYPASENSLALSFELMRILQQARIATYEGKGYQLDAGISRVAALETAMAHPKEYLIYITQLMTNALELSKRYPQAANWYNQMPYNQFLTSLAS